jgi:arylsulfatase A-like enzyme
VADVERKLAAIMFTDVVGYTALEGRSSVVCLALLSVVLLGSPSRAYCAREASGRPNILFLLAEDMSSRVGAFGDPVAVTPTLDRLAEEGVRYTSVFTAAPVCGPSRAALVTGVHPITTGTHQMRTSDLGYQAVPPPDVKAFPELLRAAGYYTYTDLKLDYQFSGVLAGSGPFAIWDDEGFSTHWRNRPEGKPFFGLVNFVVTHESAIFPRLVLPRVWEPHGLVKSLMGLNYIRLFWGHEDVVSPEDVSVPPYYPDTPAVRADLARHYNNIHRMDEMVAELLEQLERDGLADSTIVIWTTDHGDGLPRAKRELYDSGIRVPMIVRWPQAFRPPGVEPGATQDQLVSFVDLAPTILSLAEVPVPGFMQGRGFLRPDAGPRRRYIHAARDRMDTGDLDRRRAVRDKRFKYIRNYHPERAAAFPSEYRMSQRIQQELWALHEEGSLTGAPALWFEAPRPAEELFDTRIDPHEIENLVRDPVHARTLERLRGELDRWLAQTGDLGAIPEDEMIEQMWPGREQPSTTPPRITLVRLSPGATRVTLTSSSEGSSIGYRVNGRADDGSDWNLYVGPFEAQIREEVEAKAVRYGYAESEVVKLRIE